MGLILLQKRLALIIGFYKKGENHAIQMENYS
jgi:hypothetical protein